MKGKIPVLHTMEGAMPMMQMLDFNAKCLARHIAWKVSMLSPAKPVGVPVRLGQPSVPFENRSQGHPASTTDAREFLGATASELVVIDRANFALLQAMIAADAPIVGAAAQLSAHIAEQAELAQPGSGPALGGKNRQPLPVPRKLETENPHGAKVE